MREDVLTKMRQIRTNLEVAQNILRNAQNELNNSITINNESFKQTRLENLRNRIDRPINELVNNIIPKI